MERKEHRTNAQEAISWNRSHGWRAGDRYIDPQASAADVVRFERDEYENDLDTPEFFLEELDRKGYKASDVVWVCRTRAHARRYAGRGIGQPYKEDLGQHAVIVATDHEEATGYLVLFDATRLDPAVLERYRHYRRAQAAAAQTPCPPQSRAAKG